MPSRKKIDLEKGSRVHEHEVLKVWA
jgi:hypothetical protein